MSVLGCDGDAIFEKLFCVPDIPNVIVQVVEFFLLSN